MRALILNSGIGKRMGELTENKSKCMVELADQVTVLDLEITKLLEVGISDIVITTGPYAEHLEQYATERYRKANFTFVNNPIYDQTNYIYSIALAEKELHDDIILMHGDLVFETGVLQDIVNSKESVMAIDKTLELPEKDFKAVIEDGKISKVGIEFFDQAYAAQPLYKLNREEWEVWLGEILAFCQDGNRSVYAENALNQISDKINLKPFDVNTRVCTEVDTPEDLDKVKELYNRLEMR